MKEKKSKLLSGFFIIMIFFTFLSKITDSLTVGKVQIDTMKQDELTFKINGIAKVKEKKRQKVKPREGYIIKDIQGSYAFKRDKNGCVIDTETAYELFQDTNVVGNIILCNEKEYQIRGIVKTKESVFLRQSIEEDKEEFNQLEFCFKRDLENKIQSAELFLEQYEKGQYAVFIDGILYRTIAERFSTLPYWLIAACMIVTAGKSIIKKKQKNRLRNLIFIILIFLYIVGLYYCIGNPFYIPAEWIPTKWSDFEFWTVKCKDTMEHIERIRYLVPNTKDVMLMNAFYKSLICILSSLIMIIESIRRMIKEV